MSNAHMPIVVTHIEGVKFAVDIAEHRLVVDQPARSGGDGAGPAPLDLLGASLGACVAYYVSQYCESRAIPTDGLRIEVRQHSVLAPSRVGGFDVRVMLPPDVPDQVVTLIERVATRCPAHNTLSLGSAVSISVETGIGATAT